ncbi:MAG: hypothetical protein J7578_07950 [Chitinophagaceae bacterium]|nr:hypothetical protein [Chitinophagaceae bacterium]
MGLFSFFGKNRKQDNGKPPGDSSVLPPNTRAKAAVAELESRGYFNYASPEVTEEMKLVMAKDLLRGIIPSIRMDKAPYKSLDLRYFGLDGEDLFEQGGVLYTLEQMQPTFNKIGVVLKITDHLEEWDNKHQWLNHEISINGKRYILFHHFTGYGWGEAAQRFANMINDQLELQGSVERLFLSSSGNDGCCIFLNEQLYRFISPYITDHWERILPVDEWCKVMNVSLEEI